MRIEYNLLLHVNTPSYTNCPLSRECQKSGNLYAKELGTNARPKFLLEKRNFNKVKQSNTVSKTIKAVLAG